jgi:proline utilization trans-activator
MPDIHEDGSILFVEVLSLCGYFMQNLGRRDAAFLYLGIALRMAVSLALHQEVSAPLLSDMAREHRRRLFWSVYSMDRILCAKSGNPITILDEDIGIASPTTVTGELDERPALVLRHYTELSRILGRIMKTIYRKTRKSGSSLMLSVQEIMTSLSLWHRDLPNFLRFDSERLNTSRESVSTLLHYHQCINMTARPLLFHVVQQRIEAGLLDKEHDWRRNLSQTTIAVIEACIVTARNTISMMTTASQKDLVATYGYMDGEHVRKKPFHDMSIRLTKISTRRSRLRLSLLWSVLHFRTMLETSWRWRLQ